MQKTVQYQQKLVVTNFLETARFALTTEYEMFRLRIMEFSTKTSTLKKDRRSEGEKDIFYGSYFLAQMKNCFPNM